MSNVRKIIAEKVASTNLSGTIAILFDFKKLRGKITPSGTTRIPEENIDIIRKPDVVLVPHNPIGRVCSWFMGFFVYGIYNSQNKLNKELTSVLLESERLADEREELLRRISDLDIRLMKMETSK